MAFFRVNMQERVDFSKGLSIMLKSGISLNEALSSLGEQAESHGFGKAILRARNDIVGGTPLSKALAKEDRTFGSVFVSLVKAGEESGTLEESLYFLSDWFERSADLRMEVKSATLYPKIVLSAAVLLGGTLAVFILPRLVPLFGQLNVELPVVTKILLAIALFVQSYWLLVIIGIVAVVFLFILLNRIPFVRNIFHFIYLNVPFLGKLTKNYQLALVTQLFGTLLKSGVRLSESADIVSGAATNMFYKRSLKEVEQAVVEGTTLSESLKRFPELYPPILLNIVEVGEKSGALSDSFAYLSEYYTKIVNTEAKRLPTIVEPILLTFIAFVVGFIALSIIMPIYTLTGSIT